MEVQEGLKSKLFTFLLGELSPCLCAWISPLWIRAYPSLHVWAYMYPPVCPLVLLQWRSEYWTFKQQKHLNNKLLKVQYSDHPLFRCPVPIVGLGTWICLSNHHVVPYMHHILPVRALGRNRCASPFLLHGLKTFFLSYRFSFLGTSPPPPRF